MLMMYAPVNAEPLTRATLPARHGRSARSRAQTPALARWLDLLCIMLVGYALLGKGWAYLGVPPVFVGEVTLLVGLILLLRVTRWRAVLSSGHVWFLLMLMAWCAVRTLPFVPQYGADALRDAAVCGYGLFAVIVFAFLIENPARLGTLVKRFEIFAYVFLLAAPLIWVTTHFFGERVPLVPGSDVPIVHAKAGDLLVHLAGILAFWAAGWGRAGLLWLLVLIGNVVGIGVFNRGGMLSFVVTLGLCLALRPQSRLLWRFLLIVVILALVLAATDLRLSIPGRARQISFSQVIENLGSVAGESGASGLDATREWRLHWWGDIVGYTVNGPYFWTGKGFGVNLADDDGYQGTQWEGRLRSPHNGHLTVLARAGVPGLIFWGLVHAGWAFGMLRLYYRAKAAGDLRWAAAFQFLLCYWLAFMTNAAFDVFIEGPMGGIWLWTIYGVGLAAMWIYKVHPQALHDGSGSTPAVR